MKINNKKKIILKLTAFQNKMKFPYSCFEFPHTTWLLDELEKKGIEFSSFKPAGLDGLMCVSDDLSIELERVSEEKSKDGIREEYILLEFDPVTTHEYHLVFKIKNEKCIVTDYIEEAVNMDPNAQSVFHSYKEGIEVPIEKALQDVITYATVKELLKD